MKRSDSFYGAFCLCAVGLLCLLVFPHILSGQDKDWRPITPEELQMKAPKVEPDADAEAIVNCAGVLQDGLRDDVARIQSVAMQALYEAAPGHGSADEERSEHQRYRCQQLHEDVQ